MRTTVSPTYIRSNIYYAKNDFTIFQVDDTLFRVSIAPLIKYVPVFADMSVQTLDQKIGSEVEGGSDESPIMISGIPASEFEALLDMVTAAHHGLGFGFESTPTSTWLDRIAAAIYWDISEFRILAMEKLGASNDHCTQLIAASRFGFTSWKWPAVFGLCLRDHSLTVEEIQALSAYPDALHMIMSLRAAYAIERPKHLLVVQAEMRMRAMMFEMFQLEEPITSEITPPLSGYRIHIRPGMGLPEYAPDKNNTHDVPLVGSAGPASTPDNCIVPGQVRPAERYFRYPCRHNEEINTDDFSILPFDESRMEWIQTSNGRVPFGKTPVHGGWEGEIGTGAIYHAYAILHGTPVAGKTNEAFGCAILPDGGEEKYVYADYYILVWKHCYSR